MRVNEDLLFVAIGSMFDPHPRVWAQLIIHGFLAPGHQLTVELCPPPMLSHIWVHHPVHKDAVSCQGVLWNEQDTTREFKN